MHQNKTDHPFEPGESWEWCYIDKTYVEYAPKHFNKTDHPFEPGESWEWCYIDKTYVDPKFT